jgi:hypothetical protein
VERAGRLPKPLIEVTAALATRNVCHHPIEHEALLFVFVEAQIEKLA